MNQTNQLANSKVKYNYTPGISPVDPNDINLLTEDKFDLLYNERALEQPSSEFVKQLSETGWHGVVQVIERAVLSAEGDVIDTELCIVAGRRRVINAIEAGLSSIDVEVLDPSTSEVDQIAWMLIENEHRKEDNVINKAKVVNRLIEAYLEQYRPQATTQDSESGEVNYGGDAWRATKAQVKEAKQFASVKAGCSFRRIEQLLGYLDAPKKVQNAIQSGKITASDADTAGLLTLSKEKAEVKLEKMLDRTSGGKVTRAQVNVSKGSAKERGKKGARGKQKSKKGEGNTPSEIKLLLGQIAESGKAPSTISGFVSFLLGEITAEETNMRWLIKLMVALSSGDQGGDVDSHEG